MRAERHDVVEHDEVRAIAGAHRPPPGEAVVAGRHEGGVADRLRRRNTRRGRPPQQAVEVPALRQIREVDGLTRICDGMQLFEAQQPGEKRAQRRPLVELP